MSEPELTRFAASLTPTQRHFLVGLFDRCLGGGEGGADDPARWQAMLDLHRQLRQAPDQDPSQPFTVTVTVPGEALVTVARRLLAWPGIWEPASHAWLKELKIVRLTIDLEALDEMNSASIAWLVTLAQHLPGSAVRLVGVNETIRRALRVLHLDRVLVIADA
jgi:ABC-type transporter Mla MlaB component